MKQTEYTVLRKTDKLGRLVIPHDLRRRYGILPRGEIRLTPQKDGILLTVPDREREK